MYAVSCRSRAAVLLEVDAEAGVHGFGTREAEAYRGARSERVLGGKCGSWRVLRKLATKSEGDAIS